MMSTVMGHVVENDVVERVCLLVVQLINPLCYHRVVTLFTRGLDHQRRLSVHLLATVLTAPGQPRSHVNSYIMSEKVHVRVVLIYSHSYKLNITSECIQFSQSEHKQNAIYCMLMV